MKKVLVELVLAAGFLLMIFFLLPCSIVIASGDIIPADRRIDWTYAGIPGGIPKRTTICKTIDSSVYGKGATDATAVIQTALDNCPNDQVVYLPAGTYGVSGTIWITSHKLLRGAGPGTTTLKRIGGSTSEMVSFDSSIFIDISSSDGTPDIRTITTATKDSRTVTLNNATGMSVGDLLLLNQLNDGGDVDSVGFDGKCTFCGLANGDRSLGQYVEITAISGNQVSINVPLHWTYSSSLTPWAYHITANHMSRYSGIENLTFSQDAGTSGEMIFFNGAQYCWIKNVEFNNIKNSAITTYHTLQSEFRDNYMHTLAGGAGHGEGYGIVLTMYSSNNLVYNNIAASISSGGIETHGGASGNVMAYNYLYNIYYGDSTWLISSPAMNHGAYPKMNLWEGNVGYMAEGDPIWGSGGYLTVFRSQSKGWMNDTAVTNNAAIRFAHKNYYMNVVGSVLGTAGKSNQYEMLAGQAYDSSKKYIYVLGHSTDGGSDDSKVVTTFYRHGNYDYVTNSTVWDSNNSNHTLPASLYLSQKPDWWCTETPWPPIGPDVTGGTEDAAGHVYKIPAQRRFEGSPCTLGNAPTPSPFPTASVGKPGDANGDGKVDDLDYTIWANNYGISNATGVKQGDFNNDHKADDLDYTIWANNYSR